MKERVYNTYSTSHDLIHDDLIHEIKDDIKGNQEETLEKQVISDLSELKSELGFEERLINNLYRREYKDYLQSQQWNEDSIQFIKLQSIKESILLRNVEDNEQIYKSSNKFSDILYRLCSIDLDLTKNSKRQNIMKGAIDTILRYPQFMVNVFRDMAGFSRKFISFFKNLDIDKMMSYFNSKGYGILSSNLLTSHGQYKFGGDMASIVMAIVVGGVNGIVNNMGKNAMTKVINGAIQECMKSTRDGKIMLTGIANIVATDENNDLNHNETGTNASGIR